MTSCLHAGHGDYTRISRVRVSINKQSTCILVNGSGHSRLVTILNSEGSFLGLARGGRGRVVGVLASAAGAALSVGHPEIGRAGVEIDNESLLVGTDCDGTGPLEIVFLISKSFTLALDEVLWESGDVDDVGTRVERFSAAVGLEVDQILAVLAVRTKYISISLG